MCFRVLLLTALVAVPILAALEGVIGEPEQSQDVTPTDSGDVTIEDHNSSNNDSSESLTIQDNTGNNNDADAGSQEDLNDEVADPDDASVEGDIVEPPLDDDSLEDSGGSTLEDDGGSSSSNDSSTTDDGFDSAVTTTTAPENYEVNGADSDNDGGADGSNDDDDEEINGEDDGNDTSGVVDKKTANDKASGGDGVVARRRRRRRDVGGAQEIVLSKSHHPLEVTLVLLDDSHRRVKRTSFNKSSETWPHHIPYVYHPSYNKANIYQLEKVLSFLKNRLCVDFKNEPGYDPSNKNWFKEHGYSTNAFIQFRTKSTCYAVYGRGKNDKGGRNISPCNQFFSMMHEVVHSLGGIHTQNYPDRQRYITLHMDNIDPRAKHNFRKYPADSQEIEYETYDPSSILNYARTFFTLNGQPTFNYIRREMAHLSGVSTYHNILYEMTQNYKCREKFCPDEDSDCGTGYLGYVNEKCVCVCPPGFDPAERCKKAVNSAGPPSDWPDTPFTMYKATECPAGMEEGLLPLTTKKRPKLSGVKLAYSGKTLNVKMCTKTTPTVNVTYDLWPMGSYCIGKIEGVPCSKPFKEGEITMTTKATAATTGSVGEVLVNGNQVTTKYCCQDEGDTRFPMKLPNDKPFRLLAEQIRCQQVEGMWTIPGSITLLTKASKKGHAPRAVISKRGFRHVSCYYQPAVYGCSQDVALDANNPSVTISVPKKGSSREANRRCFYHIQAPKGDRLRLTINSMKLHPSDNFLIKRFNLLENPNRINPRDPPRQQMVTEGNVMLIEYWSYFKSHYSLRGASFTVDLLPADKLCYNAETKGTDYAGKKEISETYEECIPWEKATSCPDFPWKGTDGLHLLNSGKSCRNQESHGLLQPWCYTYVNGTFCNKRYCDACNEVAAIDLVHNCATFIKDPSFCEQNLGRFACFKSCGMDRAEYDKSKVKCGKPTIPSGLTASGDLQDSYDVGASVSISCGGQDTKIECTTLGWTPFDEQCAASQCIDASQLCQNALAKFPEFCTNKLSKESAEKLCKKSCGLCEKASCSVSSGASYSLVSPESGSAATGQDVTFACNDGLNFKSGDLQRACSVSGDLLGEEPTCDASNQPVDINLNQVTEKFKSIPKYQTYLMLADYLRVPYDGKITRWYFFCKKSKTITMLVYRKTSNAKQFTLVGSNAIKCAPMHPWSHDVPAGDQITVQKGDILGVNDSGAGVLMQPCGIAKKKLVPVATVKVRKIKALLKKSTATFKGTTCAWLAIGARLEPN